MKQGLLLWLFEGGFKVSTGTASWYRSSYGIGFDDSEMPVKLLAARLQIGQRWRFISEIYIIYIYISIYMST